MTLRKFFSRQPDHRQRKRPAIAYAAPRYNESQGELRSTALASAVPHLRTLKLQRRAPLIHKEREKGIALGRAETLLSWPVRRESDPPRGSRDEIYLDFAARAPVAPAVQRAVQAAQHDYWGNPHNRHHQHGRAASDAIDAARRRVAACIGATPQRVVFTSGATESNNLALLGLRAPEGAKGHIVTCVTEHDSVLGPCRALERSGRWKVTYLPVNRYGRVSAAEVQNAITEDTTLISLMWANNEIGTLHEIEAVAEVTRSKGVLLHCDATQAVGKVPIDVERCRIDLLSLSGHKLYGPPGTGALYIRDPEVLSPLMYGGGQQNGLRPGAADTPGIVGLGVACELASAEQPKAAEELAELTRHLRTRLSQAIPGTHVLTPKLGVIPGLLCVAFDDVEADALVGLVDRVAVSTSSACSAMRSQPSHVLTALSIPPRLCLSAIRISMGRSTSRTELDNAIDHLRAGVRQLRSGVPVRRRTHVFQVQP